MKGITGLFVGALALGTLTAFYHQNLPTENIQWPLVFLQAAPAGAALGLGAEIALRVPLGMRRALCCFAAGFLALVPLGVWGWLTVSGNPFEAIPNLLRLLLLCAPTLGASFLMGLCGLLSLRPGRFRTKNEESSD
jgi:peptidoglycan/LPS O-acetylase OafA/YrhL